MNPDGTARRARVPRMPRPPALKLLLASAAALVVLASTPAMSSAATTSPNPLVSVRKSDHMFNKRYCEYLFVRLEESKLVGDVWNTFGLNKCPADQWKASDASALKALVPGTLAVKLNGPRYWLIDHASITWDRRIQPLTGTVRSFFGLKMRMLTTVDVPVVNGVPGIAPYVETIVNRRTDFSFSRRNPVYQLVSPEGDVYAMQAYSQIVDPKLTRRKLGGLGSKLELPDGWKFRTRHLKRDLTLKTDGKTTVLQDELQNTYQLVR